ncbi:MAG: hypothetical protein SAK29_29355 [Scytonema sp. PMC 1069.18]|nr:hypothetical protein [Scytonema sp. PMC 1069.18]MEC4887633.1 hypothetical protein [Scytonema sp. PMC 1070.18]
MNQPSRAQLKVNCPSLTLYAFHLRHSLTEGFEQVREDAAHLWEQCVQLGNSLDINELKSLKSTIEKKALENQYSDKHSLVTLELLDPPKLEFSVPTQPESPSAIGEIYPYRIHDTYAIDLTLRYEESVDVTQLGNLNLQGLLLSNWMRPNLGETLVLFAEPLDCSADYQALADACVKEVLSNTIPPFIAQGKLFGSPIFEYDDSDEENPIQRHHFWVWLKASDDTLNLIGKTADYVLNLLCCRSKILFAYYQARQCYWKARESYSKLEKEAEIFKNLPTDSAQRLEKLKTLLTILSPLGFEYARILRDIQDSDSSIITNTENYNRWLAKIAQKSQEKFDDDDLEFLKNFHNCTCKRLHEQIQTDLNYLSPGRDMFQQAIAMSRGLVEIDQAERDRLRTEQFRQQQQLEAERDRLRTEQFRQQQQLEEDKRKEQEKLEKERERNFQTTVFAVGAGLSVGGIVISASSQVTDKNPLQMPLSPTASSSPHPFVLWVFGSIVSGLLAALITWYLTKSWQKHRDEKKPHNNVSGKDGSRKI